jgi:ubiquinone/menaquinone biosynthesis C-methylase UbiE
MKTRNMRDKEVLARQYQDSSNLDIRKNFHKKYSTNSIEFTDWIISKIKFFKGCRILEVGCGTGSLWENEAQLIDTFSELVLTDISKGMLDLVKERYAGRKNIQIQAMDVLDMPFENKSFDIILANSMLYHVSDLDLALENIQRILRDDGVFYATTFGKDGLIQTIQHAMFEMGLSDLKQIDDISFTLENGSELLRKHFSVVEEETYENHLEVVEPLDLVEYIFSMSSMSHIDRSHRDKMIAYFESKIDRQGILWIPQMYGMFISFEAIRAKIPDENGQVPDRQGPLCEVHTAGERPA